MNWKIKMIKSVVAGSTFESRSNLDFFCRIWWRWILSISSLLMPFYRIGLSQQRSWGRSKSEGWNRNPSPTSCCMSRRVWWTPFGRLSDHEECEPGSPTSSLLGSYLTSRFRQPPEAGKRGKQSASTGMMTTALPLGTMTVLLMSLVVFVILIRC